MFSFHALMFKHLQFFFLIFIDLAESIDWDAMSLTSLAKLVSLTRLAMYPSREFPGTSIWWLSLGFIESRQVLVSNLVSILIADSCLEVVLSW